MDSSAPTNPAPADATAGEGSPGSPLPEAAPPPEAIDPLVAFGQVVNRVYAVPELAMRAPLAGEQILALSTDTAAFVLDQLIRWTVIGGDREGETLLALVSWLLVDAPYEWKCEVYEAAVHATMECAPRFLLEVPPRRTVKNLNALRRPHFDRDVSLGERKQLARGARRDILERLLLDLDPQVIAKLCQNPAVQQQDILTIATRRPIVSAVLLELARSQRWLVRYEVRRAIVHNPYTPTGLSLKLLPFLHGTDIRKVARSTELHTALTETAANLLVIRAARAALRP